MESWSPETLDSALRRSLARRMFRRSVANGQITLPAAPGMIDEYVKMCGTVFAGVGRPFTDEQLADLREALESQLSEAYTASQRSSIVISYRADVAGPLQYHVSAEWLTIEGVYDNWVATREPPLFGTQPDARIWALANEAAHPGTHPVLDIGAGTGRNALPLARRGHPVDVVEVTAKFADMISADAQRELLNVRVIQRDVFETMDDLRQDYMLILVSEVVAEFRTAQQLRTLFELAARSLAPGGKLVFNAFVAHHTYRPDDAARQLGEQMYTSFFTWDEMSDAARALPLQLVADDSAYDYEKQNLPVAAWPPTGWYADWAQGRDLFDLPREQCPIELRWLVYQKPGSGRRFVVLDVDQ